VHLRFSVFLCATRLTNRILHADLISLPPVSASLLAVLQRCCVIVCNALAHK
ncbi:hypothetical protein F2P79_018115, partial [Pimephales promelas]